jgi:hypothetical protein
MRSSAVLAGARRAGSPLRRRSAWLAVAVSILSIGAGASVNHLFRSDSALHSMASGIQVSTKGMAAATPAPETPSSRVASDRTLPAVPFHAELDGMATERAPDGSGRITIDLSMRTTGVNPAELSVVLVGRPADGAVVLASSSVAFGPVSDPARYRGQVMALDEEQFVAQVWSGRMHPLDLDVILHIDPASGSVRGTVDATSATEARRDNEEDRG